VVLLKYAAAQLNKVNSTNGDLLVPNNAYFAMVDSVMGLMGSKKRGYKKDFDKLCSSSVDPTVTAGCAMLAVNFDATNRRDISIYYYQVRLLWYRRSNLVHLMLSIVVLCHAAVQHAGLLQHSLREERADQTAEEHAHVADPDILFLRTGALARLPGRRRDWELLCGSVPGRGLRGVCVHHAVSAQQLLRGRHPFQESYGKLQLPF
jgi:hypothetical protein